MFESLKMTLDTGSIAGSAERFLLSSRGQNHLMPIRLIEVRTIDL